MELKSFFELAANAKVGTVIVLDGSDDTLSFKLDEDGRWLNEDGFDLTDSTSSDDLSEKTWYIKPVKERNLNLIEACQLLKDEYAVSIARDQPGNLPYIHIVDDQMYILSKPLSLEDVLANDWYVMSKV